MQLNELSILHAQIGINPITGEGAESSLRLVFLLCMENGLTRAPLGGGGRFCPPLEYSR